VSSNEFRPDRAESGDDPRVRRRRRRRADARKEILDAAWKIADEEGIGAVALSEVARRVGMRAPSLYNYFSSKHAIVDAMFQQAAIEFRTTMSAPLEARSRHDSVRALAFRFLDFALARPARFELLFHRPVPGFFPTEAAFMPALEADAVVSQRLAEAGLDDPVVQAYCRASITGVANQQIANQLDPQFNADMVEASVDVVIAMADHRRRAQPA
jgi:AcrR family transcriptional regulator